MSLEEWDWAEWIAGVCAISGWPWDQVESLTIPEVQALGRAWKVHPPLPSVLGALMQSMAPESNAPKATQQGPTATEREWLMRSIEAFRAEGGVSGKVLKALGEI